jgi:hypothetical protein
MRLDMRPVALVPVIEAAADSMRPAARAKAIALETILEPDVGLVSGDPSRLQQIVWNLVSNAIKFTPKNGRVEIRLTHRDAEAEIRIADTGQGIAPGFLSRVFERFTQEDATRTRRYGGLGLGLAIVRHLVELHGGTVTVESAGEGTGATFTVSLPLIPVRVSDVEWSAAQAESEPHLGGLRVLVVDDEADTREFLLAALAERGAVATAAASAEEALAALDRERPDVVLCDIAMPGQDGYDLLRSIRERTRGGATLAVAALTAHAGTEDRDRALAAGFRSHIAKPLDPIDLARAVARLAGRAER